MRLVAADTHALLWYLEDDKRLSHAASTALDGAEQILVPSICLIEITYLVEKGRLHSVVLPRLIAEFEKLGTTLQLAALDFGIALALQKISRFDVPDMPDRVIAATAFFYGAPLVTKDSRIHSCGINTIW